jgi:hypothetical protein
MATKKTTKSKPKRRKKSLSSGGTKRKRRSPARRKGFLSDATNPTVLMNGAKQTLAAATGGVAGTHLIKWLSPTASKMQKALFILGVGLAGNIFGFHNMTSGAVGAMTAGAFPNGLNDDGDTNFADQDSLQDQPLFLDEQGAPMVLEEGEDGQAGYRYLSEEEVRILDEAGAFDQYQEV